MSAFTPEIHDLQTLIYGLYQLDWERQHNITVDDKVAVMKEYLEVYPPECFTAANPPDQTFDEYFFEVGYNGSLYVCFDEFLDAEYHDEEYVSFLLKDMNPKYFTEYLKDVHNEMEIEQ